MFSPRRFLEATPCPSGSPPLAAVRPPRLLRMQTLLEDKRTVDKVREGARRLESTVMFSTPSLMECRWPNLEDKLLCFCSVVIHYLFELPSCKGL